MQIFVRTLTGSTITREVRDAIYQKIQDKAGIHAHRVPFNPLVQVMNTDHKSSLQSLCICYTSLHWWHLVTRSLYPLHSTHLIYQFTPWTSLLVTIRTSWIERHRNRTSRSRVVSLVCCSRPNSSYVSVILNIWQPICLGSFRCGFLLK